MFTPVTGRAVLVTGGTKGIGKGIARVFLQAGARVAISARDPQAGAAAVAELGSAGGEVEFIAADVGDAGSVERMVAATVERFGGLDVLCANAGVFPKADLREMTERDIDEIFATNVKGTMLVGQGGDPGADAQRPRPGDHHLLDHRTDHRRSRLVALRRDQGGAARLHADGCDRARRARDHRQRGAAWQHRERGRRGDGRGVHPPGWRPRFPQKRLGKAADIGYAALFLATDEAAYITGQTIVVDGGQVLPESLSVEEEQ